jgi:Fe2+ transport system protein FeoA
MLTTKIVHEQNKTGRFSEIGFESAYQTAEAAEDRRELQGSIKPLNELERGQTGRIVSIKMRTPEDARRLLGMGILPNSNVRLIANYAHYVIFLVDYREFVAEKEVACGIFVHAI